jgi:4-diphosphocytidyl-2C-methyl-D-erythritol kinase
MKAALRRAGALAAAMSGGGSAVFGLFQRAGDASAAMDQLSGSGWKVVLSESLGRVEYARRSRPARVQPARPLARKPRID